MNKLLIFIILLFLSACTTIEQMEQPQDMYLQQNNQVFIIENGVGIPDEFK